jgi:DNA-directed RNA polymerase subunit RPC12/RpoP
MSQAQQKPIPDPHCRNCSAQMQLAKTAPHKNIANIENRTYECPQCGHSEDWVQSI